MHYVISLLFAFIPVISSVVLPRDDVHLAVSPNCGSLTGSPADVNAGVNPDLSQYKTIVSFGDSYTFGGASGGESLPLPEVNPPNPTAGGRMSNGKVWAEYLSEAANATLRDYAYAGAVVDSTQWPSLKLTPGTDFLTQVNTFIGGIPRPDPATTLYTVFFGIEDYELALKTNTTNPQNIYGNVLYTILRLASSPIFAKNVLIIDNYGRGMTSAFGEEYKSQVFAGVNSFRKLIGLNIAFADLSTLWKGVLGPTPGAAAFGYDNAGTCLTQDNSTEGCCTDPDKSFYWMSGLPTTVTHRLISDYIQEVLTQCQV
ncbi:carbohydrate esterase family 16 protein [Cyathus striatus]|nr:carbohydrate esterase family 16 protein [Cyathus striatus]